MAFSLEDLFFVVVVVVVLVVAVVCVHAFVGG